MFRKPQFPANQRRPGARLHRSDDLHALHDGIRETTKRRKRNQRLLVVSCKLMLLFAALGGMVYGVRVGMDHFFWENPEYDLSVVELRNDGAILTREMVMESARLEMGTNVFSINLAGVREAISRLPEVREVDVRRVLPNKISITMAERRPIAWLADPADPDPAASERSLLIDASGTLFKPKRFVRDFLSLPVFYGLNLEAFFAGQVLTLPEVESALELVLLNNEFNRFRFHAIDLSKGYCMVVSDERYAQLTFGLDDIDKQFERLNALYDYLQNSHQEIQSVNLMVERNMPVVFGTPTLPPMLLSRKIDRENGEAEALDAMAAVAVANGRLAHAALVVHQTGGDERSGEADAVEGSAEAKAGALASGLPPAPTAGKTSSGSSKTVASRTPPSPSVKRTTSSGKKVTSSNTSRGNAKTTTSRSRGSQTAAVARVRKAVPVAVRVAQPVPKAQPVVPRAIPVAHRP